MSDKRYDLIIDIKNNLNQFVGDLLFLTGDFNRWMPNAVEIGRLPAEGQSIRYVLSDLSAGPLALKVNRGSWATLTATKVGRLEAPYIVEVGRQSHLSIEINGWRDTFPSATASPQVHLLQEAFYFPKLGTHKTLWIYLPQGYDASDTRYPVLYMHDGQYLFDEATSQGKAGPVEWGVDETIDASPHPAIVVAMASARDPKIRQEEYLLHATHGVGNARGRAYLADIVSTVKPFVDQKYRTLSGARHTVMVGSSLGGLATLYAGLWYPDVFGCLGVFSPSIWLDERSQFDQTLHTVLSQRQTTDAVPYYYLYGGQLEDRRLLSRYSGASHRPVHMVENMQYVASCLRESLRFPVEVHVDPSGKHGAWYWQQVFPRFYQWWYKTFFNS